VTDGQPYYRRPLAFVHDRGYAAHADACAPGILELLAPLRRGADLVVELGCGSGLLTRHLVAAGHRVLATDASPAMLDLARAQVPGPVEIRPLVLPDDPIPPADAVVSVGHVLNYLPDAAAIERALAAIAGALRPGGILALDLCDLEWGAARRDATPLGRVGDDWAIVTRFSLPAPDRFVREIAAFTREPDGTWRRDDERHDNVLIEVAEVPALLARHGVEAEVRPAFGSEGQPAGLYAVVGRRPA
jgi:SAM-dependent methyltransferase